MALSDHHKNSLSDWNVKVSVRVSTLWQLLICSISFRLWKNVSLHPGYVHALRFDRDDNSMSCFSFRCFLSVSFLEYEEPHTEHESPLSPRVFSLKEHCIKVNI